MNDPNTNIYSFKWKKGLLVKTKNNFVEGCIGIAIIAFVVMHELPGVLQIIKSFFHN
jgi:hypothetical protein